MAQYTYLIVNILTIMICFSFSFHPKIRFYRYFGAFLLASVTVGVPFIIWDIWFTARGVWWFDDKYIMGLRIAGLPIEEILFFVCIPFSCVFTHYCLNKFFDWGWAARYNNGITVAGCLLAILSLLKYSNELYTAFTAIVLFLTLIIMNRIVKYNGLGQLTLAYLLLMPGFITVNGVLTGTGLDSPVVNYTPSAITGYRILTIPLEDFAYGYVLVLFNIMVFNAIRGKKTLTIAVHKP